MAHPDALPIRRQVLAALAGNRRPGFHFPGYLLAVDWPHIGKDTVAESLPHTPVARAPHGGIDLAAVCVLIDTTLATAPRVAIETGARQATVQLHAQFTGEPARGALRMDARHEGFTGNSAARQAISRGIVSGAGGKAIAYADASFVVLPPPAGAVLAPLPWQEPGVPRPPALKPAELDARERAVLRACNTALRRADDAHGFLAHFWGVLPKPADGGARLRLKIAPQHANRVGHVQGGLLLGFAAATGCAAVPRHAQLSSISAWFIKPGEGAALSVRSRVIHAGRSFAVVRTEIRNADRSLALEAVSNHAAV